MTPASLATPPRRRYVGRDTDPLKWSEAQIRVFLLNAANTVYYNHSAWLLFKISHDMIGQPNAH